MIKLNEIKIGSNKPFVLIAGPCVVESFEIAYRTALEIKELTGKLGIPFIYKSSFKKANRTSIDSFVGLKEDEALKILEEVKSTLSLPVLTDIHSDEDIKKVAAFADIVQIPAFLCRQTDLLLAAGKSGKIVNVKKGQFLAPADIKYIAAKIKSTGNDKIMFTERGTTFGYNNLVVDMRSLVIMKEAGYPVIMDATHSVQMPGSGAQTGGAPEFIAPLARAAAAVGIDALFLEVHPDPSEALSDAASQLPLGSLERILIDVLKIDSIVKGYDRSGKN